MAKKSNQKTKSSSFGWIVLVVVALGIGAFAVLSKSEKSEQPPDASAAPTSARAEVPNEPAVVQHEDDDDISSASQSSDSEPNFRMPPYYEDPKSVKLERTMDPAIVSAAAKEGYEVARQKPELLAQLPCFCYCDRFGHGALHDCFVSNHAESCDICLKEALEANRMENEGAPIAKIREYIVDKYHPRGEHDHPH